MIFKHALVNKNNNNWNLEMADLFKNKKSNIQSVEVTLTVYFSMY